MKRYFGFIIISALVLAGTVILIQMHSDVAFSRTLTINPDKITKIVMEDPYEGTSRTTTDSDQIAAFIRHLDASRYKHLQGDQSAYMPMRAKIIYLYEGERSDFIIPYEREVMISRKVYYVKDPGALNETFADTFYESMPDSTD